ncbi:sodium-coupled monocarboxylate transporter 1 [Ixodes scapularis]|uniref:sodium-coupled monocarboxylate transporter 1 n=1 Tax=Ixodes scapularis TaxID=6945 RepID=UPI001A9F6F95|nr:sodium-coupled monocarboxylate transporter 1 [Ixodes scapularis]
MGAAVHVAEYVVFAVLMILNLAVGLIFAFRGRALNSNTDETFLGSRTLGILPLSMSILASLVTAIGLVGLTAHFYTHGLHFLWVTIPALILIPFISRVIVPVIYKLGVTSVFEYLRMRFGNKVGITACSLYFILNQVQGAVSIFAAGVAIATSFHVPLIWSSVAIGLTGTFYTALGGLRGVVWTDTLQGIIILVCPLTIVIKIAYDSTFQEGLNLRPIADINLNPYLFEASFDLTNDENVWANMIGLIAAHIYRMGMDQMVIQRYAAARSVADAQRTVLISTLLLVTTSFFLASVAMALVFWYRDCDPLLSGAIRKIEQLVPYYVDTSLSGFPGFSGFFLTGVVSATLSTVSSVINSLAATCYVDILTPYIHINERYANITTKALAFAFGSLMTILAVLVPYLGSAMRIMMVMLTSTSGPFIGLFLLALAFPWVNAKGAAVSVIITMVLQIWAVLGKLLVGVHPPRMPVTLDNCPGNFTFIGANVTHAWLSQEERKKDIFLLYRLSAYWSGVLTAVLTIFIGLVVSAATGGGRHASSQLRFTSDVFIRLWKKLNLLPDSDLVPEVAKEKDDCVELYDLSRAGNSVTL